jgi:hypothetical protein
MDVEKLDREKHEVCVAEYSVKFIVYDKHTDTELSDKDGNTLHFTAPKLDFISAFDCVELEDLEEV